MDAAGRRPGKPSGHRDVFSASPRTPHRTARGEARATTPSPGVAIDPGDLSRLDSFTVAGTTGGYSARDFLEFIHDADRIARKGLFEGRAGGIVVLILLAGSP